MYFSLLRKTTRIRYWSGRARGIVALLHRATNFMGQSVKYLFGLKFIHVCTNLSQFYILFGMYKATINNRQNTFTVGEYSLSWPVSHPCFTWALSFSTPPQIWLNWYIIDTIRYSVMQQNYLCMFCCIRYTLHGKLSNYLHNWYS